MPEIFIHGHYMKSCNAGTISKQFNLCNLWDLALDKLEVKALILGLGDTFPGTMTYTCKTDLAV